MKTARVTIEGVSPYSQSRPHGEPKIDKESADAHEKRTWRNRLHVLDGEVIVPQMALKNCLAEAATFLSERIPGKGQATYSKHFLAGVLVLEAPRLGIKADDVAGEWLYLNSDGKRGGGKRVWRCMPCIPPGWRADVEFLIMDETITEPVFAHTLEQAGKFIGIGRFRPRNGGFYGRFEVKTLKWE